MMKADRPAFAGRLQPYSMKSKALHIQNSGCLFCNLFGNVISTFEIFRIQNIDQIELGDRNGKRSGLKRSFVRPAQKHDICVLRKGRVGKTGNTDDLAAGFGCIMQHFFHPVCLARIGENDNDIFLSHQGHSCVQDIGVDRIKRFGRNSLEFAVRMKGGDIGSAAAIKINIF